MKKWKKWLALLLVIVMVTALPGTAWAAEIIAYGECGLDVTWSLDSDGVLTVSGTGPMQDWSDANTPWYENCAGIQTVRIENGVTSIGAYAFNDCSSLTSIAIPESVISIRNDAFRGCSSLTGVSIPDGVTSIEARTFSHCTNLSGITIPESVTSIGNAAFSHCTNLSSITIPDNVTGIGGSAFYGCTNLSSITIPESVTNIDSSAFYDCTSLSSITIPNSVTSIGDYVFYGCTSLSSITIPDSVTSIGDCAFYGCTSLSSITIPNNVTSIGRSAFYGCTSLVSIEIPEGVTSIGDSTFRDCTGLSSITIPGSVTSIGDCAFYVFYDSYGLKDVYYSGTKAQWNEIEIIINNDSLLNATIHCSDGDIIPEEETGNKCGDNLYWTLENGVLTITGTGDMWNCGTGNAWEEGGAVITSPWRDHHNDIQTVRIESGATSIGNFAFYWFGNLTNVSIPDSVTTIGDFAFHGCNNSLTDITIPNSVTNIGEGAFAFCPIDNISIPDSVTSIGNGAFSYTDLTSVVLPDSITSIKKETFSRCDALTNIVIPNSVSSIGEGAFEYCGLLSVTIPDSVTTISDYAFSWCTKLSSVTIPDGVTSIGHATFQNCHSLTSVTLPDSVTDIAEAAFLSSSNLADVYYGGTQAQWEQIKIDNTNNYNAPLLNATVHFSGESEDDVTALKNGVKYVPYSYYAAGGESESGLTPHFSLVSGTLPNGLALDGTTGEISGIPTVPGKFEFSYQIDFSEESGGEIPGKPEVTPGISSGPAGRAAAEGAAETFCTLTIEENTSDALQRLNDYEITTPVGTPSGFDFMLYAYTDRTMVINGPYNEFMELYIDSQKLVRGVEYEAREGSTVLTIYAQTFEKFGEGTHTLSAEYREGGKADGKLKTVSQNYTVKISQPGNSDSSNKPNNDKKKPSNSKPAATTPTTPAAPTPAPTPTPTSAGMSFGDVNMSDWFYEDVKWAYESKIMTGVTENSFAPAQSISQATIVTVLARLGNIDLSRFETMTDSSIESGKWYTTAAVWAKQSGILPDYSAFTGEETISRDQMAIMLVKYLRSMGQNTTPPAQTVAFADAEQMTADGAAAFQVLCHYDIFRGVGGNRMDPNGSTTRAQFAALAHRISDTAAA